MSLLVFFSGSGPIGTHESACLRATLSSEERLSEAAGFFFSLWEFFLSLLLASEMIVVASSNCSCFRFRREPCIRPDRGHEHIGLEFRIHPEDSSNVSDT